MHTVTVGSTKEFRETVTIRGSTDLTGYSARFVARRPDGTFLDVPATIEAPASAGVVKYVTDEGELDMVGVWHYRWELTAPGFLDSTDERPLLVVP